MIHFYPEPTSLIAEKRGSPPSVTTDHVTVEENSLAGK
jgi:hypothetical protein